MSEINPNRMIPLHIADQAVAACDKEIATLKAEVQRLKHRAEGYSKLGTNSGSASVILKA